MIYLTSQTLISLMRHHRITIRTLAARMQIPMTRIRQRRLTGLTCPYATRDWLEAITGTDPGVILSPITNRKEATHAVLRRLWGG